MEYLPCSGDTDNMLDENTVDQTTENTEEKETLETTDNQTDEVTQEQQPEGEDVEKKEDSPYAKQLEELQAELKKKEEIIDHKNRAIETMKGKVKEKTPEKQEEPSEDELADKLYARFEEKQRAKDFQAKVNAISSDQSERDVIMHHYNNSIVKSGDVEVDLKRAIAMADADSVWEQRRNRAMEERQEDFLTSFAGSSLRGESPKSKQNDPVLRQAEDIVRAVNPDAVKHLRR